MNNHKYLLDSSAILNYNYIMKKIFKPLSLSPAMSTPRNTPVNIPSMVTAGGSTSLKHIPKYTGTEMIGISIIHKSCLQPIFSKQAATDAANMRR